MHIYTVLYISISIYIYICIDSSQNRYHIINKRRPMSCRDDDRISQMGPSRPGQPGAPWNYGLPALQL